MNISLNKTLQAIQNKLARQNNTDDLYKAYTQTLRLRSQLLSVIYDEEASDGTTLSDRLSDGKASDKTVTLTIHEPLPPLKELTAAVQTHWVELIQTAIDKIAQDGKLPYYEKAFVWMDVTTPRGANNTNLWDTSNRAINLIINNLKGVFFKDDNLEHMAFGVAGMWGENGVTVVKIMPFDGFPMTFRKTHGETQNHVKRCLDLP